MLVALSDHRSRHFTKGCYGVMAQHYVQDLADELKNSMKRVALPLGLA